MTSEQLDNSGLITEAIGSCYSVARHLELIPSFVFEVDLDEEER